MSLLATRIIPKGTAYMLVILLEPSADLAILAAAKTLSRYKDSGLFTPRLFTTS